MTRPRKFLAVCAIAVGFVAAAATAALASSHVPEPTGEQSTVTFLSDHQGASVPLDHHIS